MDLENVNSSSIKSVGYDSDNSILAIEFHNGSIYHYHDVPSSEFDNLIKAESIGKHASANIYNRYDFEKMK